MTPQIQVGILSAPEVYTDLISRYHLKGSDAKGICGRGFFSVYDRRVYAQGNGLTALATELYLEPDDYETSEFVVDDVVIGVDFHWQRKEPQRFKGALKMIVENGMITLINILSVEDYLKSVISSEMNATSSPELLKAHAVISRSWLYAQLIHSEKPDTTEGRIETLDERIIWYDREDHKNFDVCADDHCQRYQGITRQSRPEVVKAVDQTAGMCLYDGENPETIADARFSKCCGGVFEEFESCWQPHHHSYLTARADSPTPEVYPDLRKEENARKWILSSPEAFCNTADRDVLAEVLNTYDQETADFFRWKVEYSAAELADIIKKRSKVDFGEILALEPLERGTSGRIIRLRIRGTKHTMVIGKELEIRRTLSHSHLYSSAFIPEGLDPDKHGVPERWVLRGAGWGHGVGLCQIGAAMMASKGYRWDQILNHYFPGAIIKKAY